MCLWLVLASLVMGCRFNVPEGPVPNEMFLPPSGAESARHPFEGTLVIDSAEMQTHPDPLETRHVFDRDVKLFPSVRLDFYTLDDRLLPAERDLIRSGSLAPGGSFWDLLVFPGRIWSERDGEEWYDVRSAHEKIAAILAASKHSWGPGKVFRYRDQDMFLLGAAIDGFLKLREGDHADIWDFVEREIYAPIGIRHAPINKTLEPDGSVGLPLIAGGYYPTLEDLARIASLIQNDGAHEGRQILHREKLAEMMYETDRRGLGFGTSGGTYHMGMWHRPFEASPECQIELHSMSGWGGHRVLMLPNGLTAIHVSREDPAAESSGRLSGMAAVAHAIRPLCP